MFTLPANSIFYFLTPLTFLVLFAGLWQIHRSSVEFKKKKKEIEKRMFESQILLEIGQRIGYELDVVKIMDTIVDSIKGIIPFSVTAYFLVNSETEISSRLHVEEVVSKDFIGVLKIQMLEALNKSTGRRFSQSGIKESFTGTIISDESREKIASLWVTPISINSRGIGVLAFASKTANLYRGEEMHFPVRILDQASRAVNNLEAIINSERAKLEAMVASMADGVLMFDKEMNLKIINPAATTLLGLSNTTNPTIFDIAKILSDRLDLRSKLDESIQTDHLVSFDNLAVGGKISQLLISPVKNAKNALLGTVVLFHDKTAQKQLEQIRDDFTAMMVHELRAPLTVVSGTTDIFLKNPGLAASDQGRQLIATMHTSVFSMLSLVNDLLDVAKIDSGKFQIIRSMQNLTSVISDRVSFFISLAVSKSLSLETGVIEANLILNFDRDRILQVLNNLISNAIKFNHPGGKIIVNAYKINSANDIHWQFSDSASEAQKIKIAAPGILVGVTDTGKGIEKNKIPELFSKFKQLHPLENEPEGSVGTGLGLVIARGIIESHGGIMFVESHFGEGATFYFTLPV